MRALVVTMFGGASMNKRAAISCLVAAFAAGPGLAQRVDIRPAKQPLLRYSIVGSSSCDRKPCYGDVMSRIGVQTFLLELAKGSRRVHAADALMKNDTASIADLMTLRLIRREGDRYVLNFALFTAIDQERIRKTSERRAESLARALLARRGDIEAALGEYDLPGVDRGAVAYFLLGCASLDWDGLDLTAQRGYRTTTQDRPDGNYVPAAEEIARASLEKIYWGSHSATDDGIHLTSFGDHHSLPRYMLPDVLWRIPGFPPSYPDSVKSALNESLAESFDRNMGQLGRMMLALRDGPKSGADLARTAKANDGEAKALLHLLGALGYASLDNGLYRARITVLSRARDEAMTRRLLAIGHEVMERWLAENYEGIEAELGDLGFVRFGVPYKEGFTMIWHYLFGIADRKLVEAGLFADPYAAARKYKGAIPAVYDLALQ